MNETTNLFYFVEIPGSDENTSSRSVAVSQMPDSSNILIKRSLSEIESVEIDEDSSHKKAKLSQDDKILSEVISGELKRVALVPQKSVQVNRFSFESINNIESRPVFKYKEEFVTSYMEKQRQSIEETRNLLPRVRSLNNPNTSLISTRDVERNTLKLAMVSDKKVSEMEMRLDKISVPDKIQLHKQMGDIIYSDLLHAMVKINKLQVLVDKLEVQLKHEKVENKAKSIQKKAARRYHKLRG